ADLGNYILYSRASHRGKITIRNSPGSNVSSNRSVRLIPSVFIKAPLNAPKEVVLSLKILRPTLRSSNERPFVPAGNRITIPELPAALMPGGLCRYGLSGNAGSPYSNVHCTAVNIVASWTATYHASDDVTAHVRNTFVGFGDSFISSINTFWSICRGATCFLNRSSCN